MSRTDELRDIAKQYGIAAVAKHIITKGATAVTEHEFTEMLTEHAKLNKLAGESDVAAFSRIFSAAENADLRRAHAIAKNAPLMTLKPTVVGGADALDVNNDRSKAYQQLTDMANELRARSPTLSVAQAFAAVFTDQANAELAARAHKRPAQTTNYAYPYEVLG